MSAIERCIEDNRDQEEEKKALPEIYKEGRELATQYFNILGVKRILLSFAAELNGQYSFVDFDSSEKWINNRLTSRQGTRSMSHVYRDNASFYNHLEADREHFPKHRITVEAVFGIKFQEYKDSHNHGKPYAPYWWNRDIGIVKNVCKLYIYNFANYSPHYTYDWRNHPGLLLPEPSEIRKQDIDNFKKLSEDVINHPSDMRPRRGNTTYPISFANLPIIKQQVGDYARATNEQEQKSHLIYANESQALVIDRAFSNDNNPGYEEDMYEEELDLLPNEYAHGEINAYDGRNYDEDGCETDNPF